MKKILITGANSYIGMSFEAYLRQWPDKYAVTTVDMIDGSWRQKDFHGYDVVFHVAGIAHVKETKENQHLYYEINRDLAVETAKKSKAEGIGQFVFMSSMSVYGLDTGVIDKNTVPDPKTNYGKSKYQAELQIGNLASDGFKVAILRPPMIYGKGCKGNFRKLENIALKFSFFPKIDNKRSQIYIDNFCEFVKQVIDNKLMGIFTPQNKEYVSTFDVVRLIAKYNNKKIYPEYISGYIVLLLRRYFRILGKAFGSLIYKDLESLNYSYCIFDLDKSIEHIYK